VGLHIQPSRFTPITLVERYETRRLDVQSHAASISMLPTDERFRGQRCPARVNTAPGGAFLGFHVELEA